MQFISWTLDYSELLIGTFFCTFFQEKVMRQTKQKNACKNTFV